MRMYQITATITKNGVITQVPTFHLNADIHGLLTAKSAAAFARKMLIELTGAEIVSTFAIEV